MVTGKRKRLMLIALTTIVVLIVSGFVGFHVAVRVLKHKVVEVLGPNSEIGNIRLGWSSVNVEGLRIKGPDEWPAADLLQAERVVVIPSLRDLFSKQYRVRSITIVKPYLSALRTTEGKLLVLPSLLTGEVSEGQALAFSNLATSPLVTVGRIILEDGVVELYDASVAQPPSKIRLEKVTATMRDMAIPGLKGKSRFELSGVVKGVKRDGQIKMEGWTEVCTRNSSVKMELRSVDLVVLQPYLIKPGEKGIQKGAFDLDLQSDVINNQLTAPGKATISDLEFLPAEGGLDTFMGLPRQSVLAFLMHNDNKITVDFVFEGDISNPQFSINQSFSERLAFAMAKVLGVDLGGMVNGVGSLGQKGGEAMGKAAQGTGSWLKRLFSRKKKP